MINRLSITVLALMTAFAVAGCGRRYKQEVIVPLGLVGLEPNVIVPEYASHAIEATGGYQAWTKTKKLCFDCVVTFYSPDGSFYLTEHYYQIYPWSNSIRISATEPQGKFDWELSRGRLNGSLSQRIGVGLPARFRERYLAEMILDITTAPIRLLDGPAEFTKDADLVRMEGLLYYPIERVIPDEVEIKKYWSNAVFYRNRDSSLVDMIRFADVDDGKFLMVRGFNYRPAEKKAASVPAKIEIFRTDARGVLQQRLVKIDLK